MRRPQRSLLKRVEKKALEAAAAEREARDEAEERRIEAERQQKIAFAGQYAAAIRSHQDHGGNTCGNHEISVANTDNTWPVVLQRSLLLSLRGNSVIIAENKFSFYLPRHSFADWPTFLFDHAVTHEKDVDDVGSALDGRV